MGIKGLSEYLNDNFHFREVLFRDFQAVAIDGNNICCKLYETVSDWKRGGEYKEFSIEVKSFFDRIKRYGIKPIVILDGLSDSNKIKQSLKGREAHNSKLKAIQNNEKVKGRQKFTPTPTLALPTFLLIVKDLGIELHVSAGEGDLLVAAISNNTPKCPVLSSDSDFFMYELRNGYIPFDKFGPMSCSLYHIDEFQKQFHPDKPMMRLLIPTIHGNDFISSAGMCNDYAPTIAVLKDYKSCGEYLSCHKDLRCKYEAAEKQYCIKKLSPTDVIQDFTKQLKFSVTVSNNSIDAYFGLMRITTTNVNVMSCAVEKISQECVWNCSQYIRQFLYGILDIPEVVEIVREEGLSTVKKMNVKSRNIEPTIIVSDVAALSPKREEWQVLAILTCNNMSDSLWSDFQKLPPELKLPVATVFYWYLTSPIADLTLVKALLYCFFNEDESRIPTRDPFSLENMHAFSQWQSVYSDALVLNDMVHSPLQATNPAVLFSGKKALFYAWNSDKLFSQFSEVQKNMFALVTSQEKRKAKKKQSSVSAATPTPTSSFVHKNPYSLLSTDVTD